MSLESHTVMLSMIHVWLETMVQEILLGNCFLLRIIGVPGPIIFESLNPLCPLGLCWEHKENLDYGLYCVAFAVCCLLVEPKNSNMSIVLILLYNLSIPQEFPSEIWSYVLQGDIINVNNQIWSVLNTSFWNMSGNICDLNIFFSVFNNLYGLEKWQWRR